MAFLQHERERALANQPKDSPRRLSSESLYLEIAALRAFYRFAENEKLLPGQRRREPLAAAPLETPAQSPHQPGNRETARPGNP